MLLYLVVFMGLPFLLDNPQQVHLTTKNGVTPLHMAAFAGHSEVVRLLMAQGANIQSETHRGFTPMSLAIQEKREEVCHLLRLKGASVDFPPYLKGDNEMTITYLQKAIYFGDLNQVDLLIQLGASVNKPNLYGYTALSHALNSKCPSSIKYAMIRRLLQAGANPMTRLPNGSPIISLCRHMGDKTILSLFEAKKSSSQAIWTQARSRSTRPGKSDQSAIKVPSKKI